MLAIKADAFMCTYFPVEAALTYTCAHRCTQNGSRAHSPSSIFATGQIRLDSLKIREAD